MSRHPPIATLVALLATPPRGGPGGPTYPQEWFTDDLEAGNAWTLIGANGTPTVAAAAAAAHSGTLGLQFATRSDGAADGDCADIHHYFQPPTQDYLTATCWARLPNPDNNLYTYFSLVTPSAGHLHRAIVRYLPAHHKWQYINAAGSYLDIPGAAYTWSANTWIPLTWRLRVSTLHYTSFTCPAGTSDLSAEALNDGGATDLTLPHLRLYLKASATPPAALDADDFRVTHSPNP